MKQDAYLQTNEDAVIALLRRNISGPIVMLNLLLFRETADYSSYPELTPKQPISGRQAYNRYIRHTLPYLHASGGKIILLGESENFIIGPRHESWDGVMLIHQKSLQHFLAFAANSEYLQGIGHRSAALLDSRLLPIVGLDEKEGHGHYPSF